MTNGQPIIRAWAYSRVSSERQYQSHLSIENQAVECKRYYEYRLAPHGVILGDGSGRPEGFMFGDDRAVSAKIPTLRRPAAVELDKRLTPGTHIIFPKIDRAWRSMRDAVAVIDRWRDRGCHIHFASENICESNDPKWRSPFAKMMIYMMTICAEMERERMSERQRDAYAARRARIAAGLPGTPGNKPPLGMKRRNNSWVPNDVECAALELIMHLREVQKLSRNKVAMLCWNHVKLRNGTFGRSSNIDTYYIPKARALGLQPSLRYWKMAKKVPKSQQPLIDQAEQTSH